MFPGQGSQRPGMFHPLHEAGPAVGRLLEQAEHILGFPLSRWEEQPDGGALHRTENAQPALFVCCLAAWHVLRARPPFEPRALLGHSLGEITALAAAEGISFEDGLRLVQRRGQVMAGADSEGGMVAVLGLPAQAVEARLAEIPASGVVISNFNAPHQVVLSGPAAELQRITPLLRQAGARGVIRLKVSVACHSPRMQKAAAELSACLEKIPLSRPRWPVLSNVTGRPHGEPEEMRRLLLRQLTAPVRFEECVRWALGQGVREFVEVGPGDVLRGLVRQIDPRCRLTGCDGSGTQGAT